MTYKLWTYLLMDMMDGHTYLPATLPGQPLTCTRNSPSHPCPAMSDSSILVKRNLITLQSSNFRTPLRVRKFFHVLNQHQWFLVLTLPCRMTQNTFHCV